VEYFGHMWEYIPDHVPPSWVMGFQSGKEGT
jgi:hypothetical protein